jgi:hypothetical protein
MMAVRPSVQSNRVTRLPLDGFKTMLIVENFYKTVEKIQILLIPDKNNKTKSLFREEYVYKIKKPILCSIAFSLKFFSFKGLCEKILGGGHGTHDNIIWRMRLTCWLNRF